MLAAQPSECIRCFIDLFNAGDLDTLLTDCYDDDIVLMVPGGEPVAGKDGVRAVLESFLGMNGEIALLGSSQIVNGDLAVSLDHWTLQPAEGDALEATTSDVLRRQADGSWKYLIDNPFGAAVVQPV
jgi:ketosteroid isomerase-like protein